MRASVIERLGEVVRRRGEAAAIEAPGERVSYAELWAWAGAIGAALASEGVAAGDRVAITAAKSPAYVAGILGAWWAGAAFVPAGEELPSARRAAILEEVAPRRCVDRAWLEARRGGPASVPLRPAGPEALAYVIFTSGSSGRPKGVRIAHRGIAALLDAQIAAFHLSERTRSLFYLSTAFDASISDIGTALLAGGTLVIAGAEELRGDALLATLGRLRITYADLPPALLGHLDPADAPACLETITIGGEVCPPAAVRRWSTRVRLVNVYGPTEATVCASLCVCDPGWSGPRLGAPLPGVIFRVVEGELWIGGECLALGYLGRPELDAERFPWLDGQRFYRTGDRVRVGEDGSLDFAGRVDRQVKVGGVRIELDEVEAHLSAHPAVEEAAVVAAGREMEVRGGARPIAGLVAHVVARGPESPSLVAELRAHLAARVPAAAVPRRFVVHGRALPRGASGKIDRGRLVDGASDMFGGSGVEEGWTGAAAVLAGIWREVLGVASVGAGDRFRALGGGSLAALEVVAAATARGLALTGVELVGDASFAEIVRGLGEAGAEWRSRAALMTAVEGAAAAIEAEAAIGDDRGRGAEAVGGTRQEGDVAASWPVPEVRSTGRRRAALEDADLLLTGATGFVGARLLAELTARRERPVACLVRAPSEALARRRLAAALAVHGLELAPERVRVVLGDLASTRLGVDASTWERLGDALGAIVHGGARVHLVEPFEALAPANLHGTGEVLRLARAGRQRPRVALISTLSVFVAAEPRVACPREDDALAGTEAVIGGYAQSKWAAEALFRRLAPPLPAICARLGLVTGDTMDGRAGERDQLVLFLRGLAELGVAPAGCEGLRVDVTPVDFAAAALAELVGAAPAEGIATYHLASASGARCEGFLDALRAEGRPIEVVSPERFLAVGAEGGARSPAAALAYLSLSRRLPGAERRLRGYDLFLATGCDFSMTNAHAALAGADLRCPPATPELLRRYVRAALAGGSR